MGGRELVLGAFAVVGRDHDGIDLARQGPRARIVGVEVCQHPAAAVIVDDDRERPPAFGHVHPGRNRAAWARDADIAHPCYRPRRRAQATLLLDPLHCIGDRRLPPRLLGREGLDRLGTLRLEGQQQRAHVRVGLDQHRHCLRRGHGCYRHRGCGVPGRLTAGERQHHGTPRQGGPHHAVVPCRHRDHLLKASVGGKAGRCAEHDERSSAGPCSGGTAAPHATVRTAIAAGRVFCPNLRPPRAQPRRRLEAVAA
jgi:hypothetical protein